MISSSNCRRNMTFKKLEKLLLSRYAGFVFATLSGILFTLANSFFKMVENLTYSEILMIRGLSHLFLVLPFLLVLQNDIRGPSGTRTILWSGSAINAICLFLAFLSFRMLPFGEAISILFCNPVIIMLLSFCFQKELCGIFKVSAVILLLLGLVLIALPPEVLQSDSVENITQEYQSINDKDQVFSNQNETILEESEDLGLSELMPWPYGYIIAFCSTITLSLSILAQKHVSSTTHYTIILFSLAICYIIAAFIGVFLESSPHGVPEHWTDIIYAIFYGVISLLAQLFLILSLQLLPASLVSIVRSLEVVLAFFVQIFWFHEAYHWSSFVGSAAVVLSVILITQEKVVMKVVSKFCIKGRSSDKEAIINADKEEDTQF